MDFWKTSTTGIFPVVNWSLFQLEPHINTGFGCSLLQSDQGLVWTSVLSALDSGSLGGAEAHGSVKGQQGVRLRSGWTPLTSIDLLFLLYDFNSRGRKSVLSYLELLLWELGAQLYLARLLRLLGGHARRPGVLVALRRIPGRAPPVGLPGGSLGRGPRALPLLPGCPGPCFWKMLGS